MKALKLDYYDEGTDNSIVQGVLCITGVSMSPTSTVGVDGETIKQPVSVNYDVYANLAACKDPSKTAVYTGKSQGQIPTNESSGYMTQAYAYLKDVVFKENNPSLVTV